MMRIDRSRALAAEGEWTDAGFASYMSMLLVDEFYNNPIASTFVRVLREEHERDKTGRRRERSDELGLSSESKKVEEKGVIEMADLNGKDRDDDLFWRRKRGRIRWFLILCLSQNPSLSALRKRRLAAEREANSGKGQSDCAAKSSQEEE